MQNPVKSISFFLFGIFLLACYSDDARATASPINRQTSLESQEDLKKEILFQLTDTDERIHALTYSDGNIIALICKRKDECWYGQGSSFSLLVGSKQFKRIPICVNCKPSQSWHQINKNLIKGFIVYSNDLDWNDLDWKKIHWFNYIKNIDLVVSLELPLDFMTFHDNQVVAQHGSTLFITDTLTQKTYTFKELLLPENIKNIYFDIKKKEIRVIYTSNNNLVSVKKIEIVDDNLGFGYKYSNWPLGIMEIAESTSDVVSVKENSKISTYNFVTEEVHWKSFDCDKKSVTADHHRFFLKAVHACQTGSKLEYRDEDGVIKKTSKIDYMYYPKFNGDHSMYPSSLCYQVRDDKSNLDVFHLCDDNVHWSFEIRSLLLGWIDVRSPATYSFLPGSPIIKTNNSSSAPYELHWSGYLGLNDVSSHNGVYTIHRTRLYSANHKVFNLKELDYQIFSLENEQFVGLSKDMKELVLFQ